MGGGQWHLTAEAARAHPEAFDFWRLYRTTTRSAAPWKPLLGPFADVPELVEQALARRPSATLTSVPMGVLSVSLVAQWTAAVDLVLTEGMCLNDAPLRARILGQAYNIMAGGKAWACHRSWKRSAYPFLPRHRSPHRCRH